MDKFQVKSVTLRMLPNDGWIVVRPSEHMGTFPEELAAFTRKSDLMGWLDDNLSYSHHQHEDMQSTMKQEG